MSCRRRPSPFELAIETIQLQPNQRAILQQRYIPLVLSVQWRATKMAIMFHTSRSIITVGSLLVPALLSIQNNSSKEINEQVYWATWFTSLLVTICNGLQSLFKLDKKYYSIHTVMEHMVSEGWQYIELTAKYSGFYHPKEKPTHDNQFIYFCHAIEKIRMRQIEEEYYKLATEGQLHSTVGQRPGSAGQPAVGEAGSTAAAAPSLNQNAIVPSVSLIPMTPLKDELMQIPEEVKRAVQEQLLRSQVDGVTSAPRGDQAQGQNAQSETDGERTTVSVRE